MSQFLKLFPGEKDYKEVSEREWVRPFEPFKDQNGFGNILGLSADVRVFDRPGGKLLVAKKWPARSFIRNFPRLMRMMFQITVDVPLLNSAAGSINTGMNQVAGSGQPAGLLPRRSTILASGAAMAVGDGTAVEDHTRNDLVSRVGPIIVANSGVVTTVDSAATLTIEITQGITIGASGGITAREIGLFMFVRDRDSSPTGTEGEASLMAYDGITATPVAQGGVIAPRYTLNFPV